MGSCTRLFLVGFFVSACSGTTPSERGSDQGSTGVNDVEAPVDAPVAPTDAPPAQDAPEPQDTATDTPADVAPDKPDVPDTVAPDVAEDVPEPPADPGPPPPPPEHSPDAWGPYAVGLYVESFYDDSTGRILETMIWYPANKAQEDGIAYFGLLPGEAIEEPSPNKTGAPYPLVLFSHGFQGINFQSFAILEYVASHGYVVASSNHPGNTFFDFNASDQQVADVAQARPGDVLYIMGEALKMSAKDSGYLSGMIDTERLAITGHSFGGWTAMVLAGGVVDVDYGNAQCAAGTKADVMCKYIGLWPEGKMATEPIPGLKAGLFYAPGGVAAFPEGALDTIKVPTMITGGSKDHMIPVDVEINPLFELLPSPKTRVLVEGASHMTWTNICDVPFAAAFLTDFCAIEGVIEKDAGFAIARTVSVAFLGLHVKDELGMAAFLDPGWLTAKYPEVAIDTQ